MCVFPIRRTLARWPVIDPKFVAATHLEACNVTGMIDQLEKGKKSRVCTNSNRMDLQKQIQEFVDQGDELQPSHLHHPPAYCELAFSIYQEQNPLVSMLLPHTTYLSSSHFVRHSVASTFLLFPMPVLFTVCNGH